MAWQHGVKERLDSGVKRSRSIVDWQSQGGGEEYFVLAEKHRGSDSTT